MINFDYLDAVAKKNEENMSSTEYYVPMEIVDKYYEDKKDPVAKPPHYNNGNIECIEYLKDNMPKEAFIGYLEGNVKKYLHRWRYKVKPTEDLKKAQWYLDYLIKEVNNA